MFAVRATLVEGFLLLSLNDKLVVNLKVGPAAGERFWGHFQGNDRSTRAIEEGSLKQNMQVKIEG